MKRTITISIEQLNRPQPGGIATYVRGLVSGLHSLADPSLDVVGLAPKGAVDEGLSLRRVNAPCGVRLLTKIWSVWPVGVPTLARAIEINRELLEGAAALVRDDRDVRDTLEEMWTNESRRSIMVAAGRSRAVDFAPDTAARAYLSLYREVVRGWTA